MEANINSQTAFSRNMRNWRDVVEDRLEWKYFQEATRTFRMILGQMMLLRICNEINERQVRCSSLDPHSLRETRPKDKYKEG